MRHIAPGGTPISFFDITKWIYNIVAMDDVLERFKHKICSEFGVKHCFFFSTGRAAMSALLSSLVHLHGEGKNEVVIPSYTCFSVPSSIAKAGLKIRICDIDPDTLDYNPQMLAEIDYSKVLCIVTANLYGIPNDVAYISKIAKDNNVFLIDDAAQCMGGKVEGRFSGTMGEAGIFSLDKGKNITSMDGGIVISNSDELAASVKDDTENLPDLTAGRKISYIAKMLFYAAFLHPHMYWIPNRLPFLKLGTTVYTTDYPIGSYNELLGAMGIQLFRKIHKMTEVRIKNARYLEKHLSHLPFIAVPRFKDYVSPVYPRFPILVQNAMLRNRIVEKLNAIGIGATTSYPTSITDIGEIQGLIANQDAECKGGKQAAERIVTLPTHPYVAEEDLSHMVYVIKECVSAH